MTDSPAPADGTAALLARRAYTLYLAGRFCDTLANTSQAVVLAWEVYELACLSMTVVEASFALTLVAGEVADRYDRHRTLVLCHLAQLPTATGRAAHTLVGGGMWPVFALSTLFGCARAFFQPTASALGPMLVPAELLPRAIATNSLAAQLAVVLGLAVGGLLCAVYPAAGWSGSRMSPPLANTAERPQSADRSTTRSSDRASCQGNRSSSGA